MLELRSPACSGVHLLPSLWNAAPARGHACTDRARRAPSPLPPPTQPRPAASPQGGSKPAGRAALIAACVGLLVGGGAAAAVLLLRDDGSTSTAVAPGAAATVPARKTAPTESGEADSANGPQGFPTADRAQMAQEIQRSCSPSTKTSSPNASAMPGRCYQSASARRPCARTATRNGRRPRRASPPTSRLAA